MMTTLVHELRHRGRELGGRKWVPEAAWVQEAA
jgi:hypothetical protein